MWTLSGFADEIDPDPGRQCALLNALGIAHVEFRSAWHTNVLNLSEEQIDAAAAVLAAHGISVTSIGSPVGRANIDSDFGQHLTQADRALTVANRFTAPYVRICSFFLRPDQAPREHRDEVLRRIAALAELAEPTGVVLLLANEQRTYGDIPERVRDILESVGSPSLRLAFDPAGYVQAGVAPFTEGYELLRPYLDCLRVTDAVRATGQVVPAGEGDGQIGQTIRALAADFDGFFAMEPRFGSHTTDGTPAGPAGFIRATRAFTTILDSEGIAYA